MDKYIEKWKEDKKFRAKIKLLLYGIFLVIVIIYVTSLKTEPIPVDEVDDLNSEIKEENKVITIPEKYNYLIKIEIDDKNYTYSGEKNLEQENIVKTSDDISSNYMFKNNEYYVKDGELYIKTTKEEVYDVVNYNYINLETINSYLSKAENNNSNQYLVYLKDIILGQDTNEYFTISVDENKISIDYTPLMKQFNPDIKKYKVNIQINEIE